MAKKTKNVVRYSIYTRVKCKWCGDKKASVAIGDDRYAVCEDCRPRVERFYRCEICNQWHGGSLGSYLRGRLETRQCSRPKCRIAYDVKYGRICCEKAKYIDCVCLRAYKCPVHGERHVGTHD